VVRDSFASRGHGRVRAQSFARVLPAHPRVCTQFLYEEPLADRDLPFAEIIAALVRGSGRVVYYSMSKSYVVSWPCR
jgi:hypothetical protein